MTVAADEVKACCAAAYGSDAVRWLLGDRLHPGGAALTARLVDALGVGPGALVADVACGPGASALQAAEPRRPLQLYERGIWDPAEQYWGEPEGLLEICLVEVIAAGPRLQFELEQLLPGGEDPDARDPILEAVALRDRGQRARARALLEGLIEWDCRCLDAHAHLGALDFDEDPGAAHAHYATGVRIAESSLPEDFGGVLGWGWIDNRPFLRCLHGLTLTSWRLGHYDQAETLCRAMLWLNPADNQGARDLLSEITAGAPWRARR